MPITRSSLKLQHALPVLNALPRPLYARTESMLPGSYVEAHHHPWVELTYAISGVLEIRTRTGNYAAVPQCAVWIPPETEHKVIAFGHTEMRSFYIDSAAISRSLTSCCVLQVSPLVRELIRHASTLPANYAENGSDGRLVQVLLDQLVLLPEAVFSLPLPQDSRLMTIYRALQSEPDDARTLGQWASTVGMSERSLTRMFRKETGLTFRLWRQRLRLLFSLAGLEEGRQVTRVALECGYESPSAYIDAFKQLFGRTPGDLFATPFSRADG